LYADSLVDDGAVQALEERRSSLLAVGVVKWSDDFRAGDGVEIAAPSGRVVARGIVSVDAAELAERRPAVEVVHRDRLVLVG